MEKYVILCLLTSATLYNYSTCWLDSKGSPDKLGGKILNFPEKVIPLCHE